MTGKVPLVRGTRKGPIKSEVDKLNSQQRTFVHHLLASEKFDLTEAAKAAGYKNPSHDGVRLLKNRAICHMIAHEQYQREKRCKLKADDVLDLLREGLFLNPLKWFFPTKDGDWAIENPRDLPDKIGQLIEECEFEEKETDDGKKTYFRVKLISKSLLLNLAMKHLGLLNESKQGEGKPAEINWDWLYQQEDKNPNVIDVTEYSKPRELMEYKPPEPIPEPTYDIEEFDNADEAEDSQ